MRINEPDVVYQVFADEIVVVNLAVGKYYSLDGVAADVFSLAIAGTSEEDILTSLTSRFGEAVGPDIRLFLGSLAAEGITAPGSPAVHGALPPFSTEYKKPVLNTYDEMQDLLLMDPIHDVDALGWPNKKA